MLAYSLSDKDVFIKCVIQEKKKATEIVVLKNACFDNFVDFFFPEPKIYNVLIRCLPH